MLQVCDTVQNECGNSSYDEFNRLTVVTDITHNSGDAGSFSYTYDRWGNRLTETSTAPGTMPSYGVDPASNRITTFTYDAAGNVINDGTQLRPGRQRAAGGWREYGDVSV